MLPYSCKRTMCDIRALGAMATEINYGLLDQNEDSTRSKNSEHIRKKSPWTRCFCLVGLFFVISSFLFLQSLDLGERTFLKNLQIAKVHTVTAANVTKRRKSYTNRMNKKYSHKIVESCAQSYLQFIGDANETTSPGESAEARWVRTDPPPWQPSDMPDDPNSSWHLPVPERFDSRFTNPCWFSKNNTKSSLRCLPYFFLAGFPKAGTTDLYSRIDMHPQVELSTRKEPHWWTRTRLPVDGKVSTGHGKSFASYASCFSTAASCMVSIASHDPAKPVKLITGEGSASTFWDNSQWRQMPGNEGAEEPRVLVADHIRYYLPGARIIVITRNPVNRMLSDYLYFWKPSANYTVPNAEEFHRRTVEAIHHITECFKAHNIRTCTYDRDTDNRVGIGLYSVYLEDWLRIFPHNQIHVLRTEDYQHDPGTQLTRIYEFLGLHELPAGRLEAILKPKHKNVGSKRKSHVEMWNSTREVLTEFYRPFNRELANILEDDRYLWEDDT